MSLSIQPHNETDDLVAVAMDEARQQLGFVQIVSREEESQQIERAILNLAVLYGKLHITILKLMWRMERNALYVELGHKDMLSWANHIMTQIPIWRAETVDRYAKAISRILPEVDRNPYVDPETGEVIDADLLLERGTITALSDYSYTFATTQDDEQRKLIIKSILDRDGDKARDLLIRRIRSENHPVIPVRVYTTYQQDRIDFKGQCSYEQWQAISNMLGPLLEEHFVKPESDDANDL